MMDQKAPNNYKTFEDHFRGPRALIKDRLKVYLPFIEDLGKIYPDGKALDLGCGRGEWLEQLQLLNIPSHGIDTDENMLAESRKHGVLVEAAEVVPYMKSLPSESHSLVTAFHVIEHLSKNDIVELLQQAMRILKPHGLLILETPNPENIVVATYNFYLDPSHIAPIPSALLGYWAHVEGFEVIKILRLQQATFANEKSIMTVLAGPGADYALVAQKCKSDIGVMPNAERAFSQEYGATMQQQAKQYDDFIAELFSGQEELARKQEELEKRQKFEEWEEFEKRQAFEEQQDLKKRQELEKQEELKNLREGHTDMAEALKNLQEQLRLHDTTIDKMQGTLLWRFANWVNRLSQIFKYR